MSISARNQLTGKITTIRPGAVNDEIEVSLENGCKLVSVITNSSKISLDLNVGKDVIALIKAPWVMLASEDSDLLFSARNQFPGKITAIDKGAVNATVHLQTDAGFNLTSVITNESVEEMALATEKRVIALVKASSVMLAVKKR